MTDLLGELREFLTIWAIGTILGVTKDGDTKFMQDYERAHFQVYGFRPISNSTFNWLCHRGVYLQQHFRVEHEEMMNQIPTDMDDDVMDDRKEDGAERSNDPKPMQQDQLVQKEGKSNSSAGSSDAGGKNSQLGKKLAYSILALETLQHAEHGLEYDGDGDAMEVEAPNSEPSSPIMQIVADQGLYSSTMR
jgi:hypothetical protein